MYVQEKEKMKRKEKSNELTSEKPWASSPCVVISSKSHSTGWLRSMAAGSLKENDERQSESLNGMKRRLLGGSAREVAHPMITGGEMGNGGGGGGCCVCESVHEKSAQEKPCGGGCSSAAFRDSPD